MDLRTSARRSRRILHWWLFSRFSDIGWSHLCILFYWGIWRKDVQKWTKDLISIKGCYFAGNDPSDHGGIQDIFKLVSKITASFTKVIFKIKYRKHESLYGLLKKENLKYLEPILRCWSLKYEYYLLHTLDLLIW